MTWTEVNQNCWVLEVVPGTDIGAVIDRPQGWRRLEAQGLSVPYRIEFFGNHTVVQAAKSFDEAKERVEAKLREFVPKLYRAVWGPLEADHA